MKKILSKWIDPAYIEIENQKKLNTLNNSLILLENKLIKQAEFITLLQNNLKARQKIEKETKHKPENETKKIIKTQAINYFNNSDQEYELNKPKQILNNSMFMPPIPGIITSKFDIEIKHFGIDIVANKNEPVSSIYEGKIIFASWTVDTGHVIIIQHNNDLISVYKHNSQLLKETGDYVKKGEAIAIIGSSGEFSTGPHLHFELWHMGYPLDPEKYIIF